MEHSSEDDVLASAILGPEPAESHTPLRAVRGGRGGAIATRGFVPRQSVSWAYTVTFENQTSEDLDEAVIFWQREVAAGPALPESRAPFPARSYYQFVLGRCNEVGSYVISVFLHGKRIFKIPAGENMTITPEIASRFHPEDVDPCADSWALYER